MEKVLNFGSKNLYETCLHNTTMSSNQNKVIPFPSLIQPAHTILVLTRQNDKKVIVTLYELACSNNTSLLKPSFLRVSSELVCCTLSCIFPPIEESITHDIKISLFCLAKKYIIYYYLLLYELQFLEGFLPLRKTVTDRT